MSSRTSTLLAVSGAAVLAVLVAAGTFVWGFEAGRTHIFPYDLIRSVVTGEWAPPPPDTPGRWRLRDGRRPWLYQDEDALTWEQLQALGYAEGTQLAPDASGVSVHTDGSWPGLNLITSGHAPEALLVDADGAVVHRWSATWEDVFPAQVVDKEPPRPYWRRARMLPDGGLLAMFVDRGAFRLDREGEVVWAYAGGVHHDLAIDGESVWFLTRERRVREDHASSEPIFDDGLVRLDLATGEVQQAFSLWEALADGPFASRLKRVAPRRDRDPLHTNTVRVLDGRFADQVPAFAAGNLLVSMRHTDLVAVVDPRVQQVVWAWAGPWHQQHEPTLVAPGHLLVFDNMGAWPRSRVLEVDPRTQEIVWAFDGGRVPLVSETCGTAQRLPGGTTLAVASDTGVAVEVDREGTVVWSYTNPARAGEDDELIATLFQVERLWGEALGPWADLVPPVEGASAEEDPADEADATESPE